MARVHVTISRVDDRGDTGAALPLLTSVPEAAQTMTSSGTSTASTIAAAKADGLVWRVKVDGGKVFIKFGTSPVAASGEGYFLLDGDAEDYSVTVAGEKIAIKDAG